MHCIHSELREHTHKPMITFFLFYILIKKNHKHRVSEMRFPQKTTYSPAVASLGGSLAVTELALNTVV